MKVTIRYKKLKGDLLSSIYLDYYPAVAHPKTGKIQRREFLGVRIFISPKTALERAHNKQTNAMVELIRAERQIDIQAGKYGFLPNAGASIHILDFVAGEIKKGTHKGYNFSNMSNYLSEYVSTKNIFVADIDLNFCEKFREFMLVSPRLTKNTVLIYYVAFTGLIKSAKKLGYLPENFSPLLDTLKIDETHRGYLSIEELRALSNTPCMIEVVKRSAMFSALTGLRHIDICKMIWSEISYSEAGGHTLTFKQQKTGGASIIPLTIQARELCGERLNDTDKVFTSMRYSTEQIFALKNWVFAAGITKKITFHAFRHTFATLQITAGTDIYTVSKLLGHKKISTTARYAHIIDGVKRAAVDKIKI